MNIFVTYCREEFGIHDMQKPTAQMEFKRPDVRSCIMTTLFSR